MRDREGRGLRLDFTGRAPESPALSAPPVAPHPSGFARRFIHRQSWTLPGRQLDFTGSTIEKKP